MSPMAEAIQTSSEELRNRVDSLANKEKEKKGMEKKCSYEQFIPYLPLYRAALKGDWKSAKQIMDHDQNALTAKINRGADTALHIAVSTGRAVHFVEKLLKLMSAKSLAETNCKGNTALAIAAIVGNTKAAKLLVQTNEDLPLIRNNLQNTPIHLAAMYGHKETARYLLSVTRDEEPSPFIGESGVMLLKLLINADFYDIALDLLKDHPKLAIDQDCNKETAFFTLAHKPLAFASGSQLGFWEKIIYHWIPVERNNFLLKPIEGEDEENPSESSLICSKSIYHRFVQQISTAFGTLRGKVHVMLWMVIKIVLPSINHIDEAKLMHKQSFELVKRMCKEVTLSCTKKTEESTTRKANALELLKKPLFAAARLGIHELVTEIMKTYPHLIWSLDEDKHHIFQLAILHRHEKIFSLQYQMGSYKNLHTYYKDESQNNLLHLAGKLQCSTRVSSAALQMQRELKWFKEVENFVPPSFKDVKNSEKKTPRMVFTEEHKTLVKQGEEWMKATASSCTVVAALIATVVFAAAFTVPGGNNVETGIPIFLHEISFLVFATSDAIALFSSSTSVLMFLSILTSRYAEKDFYNSLPMKLIVGLITLFISIASTVVAFSAALYIVLSHRLSWVVIPISLLACLPVASFGILQFPILVEMVLSTYGPSIFHKQSTDIFG